MNHPINFLERDNKAKLVADSFYKRKINFTLKSVIIINNCVNLSIIKKLIKLFYLHCSCEKVVQISNKKSLKVIKNTLSNKSENPESLKR